MVTDRRRAARWILGAGAAVLVAGCTILISSDNNRIDEKRAPVIGLPGSVTASEAKIERGKTDEPENKVPRVRTAD